MTDVYEIRKLLEEFFKDDPEKVDLWLNSPNPMLGGAIPNELIAMNRAHKVLRIIKNLLNGDLP